MWSKNGKSRKLSRRNSLRPQPVSGVPSPSSAARTRLATREETRFIQLSRRLVRWPVISAGASAACAIAQSRGRSAGSFWPSPSRVAIQGARAALTPVRIAAL
jgi:hypothetical protein